MILNYKSCLVILIILNSVISDPTPIVLWHGMGDTCCFDFSLGHFKSYLQDKIPGVYVNSLRIGSSTIEDFENGYLMSPNKQVDYVCEVLSLDPKLKGGFHAIGFSQGCQFLRGVIQRCGHRIPRVKSFISLGGQHQGVYGLPHCGALENSTCDYVRKLLNYAAYNSWVQHSLVQATYWHDPLDEKTYVRKSHFLADINNELTINTTYVNNLLNLERFVLVLFEDDTIVQPRETEWFGFYVPGQAHTLQALNQSRIYTENRLGLKTLMEDGKLVFLSSPGDHLQFSEEWFHENILKPYLM